MLTYRHPSKAYEANEMSKKAEATPKKKRNRKPIPVRDLSNLPDWTPLRKIEVLAILPMARAGFDEGVKTGLYPPPVYLSPHIPTWTLGVIKQVACGEWEAA